MRKGLAMVHTFVGIDLGWYGKPTGLASLEWSDGSLRMRNVTRIEAVDEIVRWIEQEVGGGGAVLAVDAPTVIRNETGIRPAERALNQDFRRFHAGCHAANLGRPFAPKVLAFSARLEALGFQQGGEMPSRAEGRYQIEVHPHAACVSLFHLPRIVKYKRGKRDFRAAGLRRLRRLMLDRLPTLEPALTPRLPAVPVTGNLKPAEDQIDAVLCAYIAAHWWYWGTVRNTVYGDARNGYIVVPSINRRSDSS
jgi:predicted RNase H-like nuclease